LNDRPAAGELWIVAGPIGNLDDLAPRARRALGAADVIAAEDTRTSRKLLPPRDRAPEWVTLNEHTEAARVEALCQRIAAGARVALVSDAGTPLISDPGYRLVDAAHRHGLRVVPIPGPCAAIAALSAAGLASDRFRFEGFLPARGGPRRTRLEALREAAETLVFYVPARDLESMIGEFTGIFGEDRVAAIARELTKRFEVVRRDRLAGLGQWLAGDPDQRRGEAVVLVAGADPAATPAADARRLARALAGELPPARAARIVTSLCGLDRKQAFALVEAEKER